MRANLIASRLRRKSSGRDVSTGEPIGTRGVIWTKRLRLARTEDCVEWHLQHIKVSQADTVTRKYGGRPERVPLIPLCISCQTLLLITEHRLQLEDLYFVFLIAEKANVNWRMEMELVSVPCVAKSSWLKRSKPLTRSLSRERVGKRLQRRTYNLIFRGRFASTAAVGALRPQKRPLMTRDASPSFSEPTKSPGPPCEGRTTCDDERNF